MVRASFGCYNNLDDIDRLAEMLDRIRQGDYAGNYEIDPASGEYLPRGYEDALADYFLLEAGRGNGERPHGACGR